MDTSQMRKVASESEERNMLNKAGADERRVG